MRFLHEGKETEWSGILQRLSESRDLERLRSLSHIHWVRMMAGLGGECQSREEMS